MKPAARTSTNGRPGRPAGQRPAKPVAPEPKQPAESVGNLLALYRPDLSDSLGALGYPPYRTGQVLEHLMRPSTSSFAEATALPSTLRSSLEDMGVSTIREVGRRTSVDGTVKLLLEASDGSLVETVVMPYQSRTTACISSQAGCPVGCSFCATGAAGFKRNLTPAEIVDQVRAARSVAAQSGARLSNVVFMGMGEPLLNLQAVLSSIRVLTHPLGLDLGNRSISVSTVGIPAGILRMAHAAPQVNLAVSLHAPSDRVRSLLIPDRHRHPLEDVLGAAWEHFALTKR